MTSLSWFLMREECTLINQAIFRTDHHLILLRSVPHALHRGTSKFEGYSHLLKTKCSAIWKLPMCILSLWRKLKNQSVESNLEWNLQLSWKFHWMANDPSSKCQEQLWPWCLPLLKHHRASTDISRKSLKGHRIWMLLNKPYFHLRTLYLSQSYVISLAFTLFFSVFL